MSDDGINQRHNARMQRKKEVADKKIEAARRNAGVFSEGAGA